MGTKLRIYLPENKPLTLGQALNDGIASANVTIVMVWWITLCNILSECPRQNTRWGKWDWIEI